MDYQDREATPPPETENRAPIEARLPSSTSLVGTDDESGDKASKREPQARLQRRVLSDPERLQPLGCPRVVLSFLPWESRVAVEPSVWGLADANRTFLGAGRRSAERYANDLFDQLVQMADARVRYRLGRKARNAAGREVARLVGRRERER